MTDRVRYKIDLSLVPYLSRISGLSVGFRVAGSVHKVSGYSKACTPFKEGMEGHRRSSMGGPGGFPPGNFCQK